MYFKINRYLKKVAAVIQELKDGDDIPGVLDDEYKETWKTGQDPKKTEETPESLGGDGEEHKVLGGVGGNGKAPAPCLSIGRPKHSEE